MSEPAKRTLKLFYCYAHGDKELRNALDRHLSVLRHQKFIEIWCDREINPGMEWGCEIDKRLDTADIVLFLVSNAFLTSSYCDGKEMALALQRHEEGTVRVVPIILHPVDWENTPFSKLQVLPTEAKPVTSWINSDEAYADVARGLHKIIRELQALRDKKAKEWFDRGLDLRKSQRYEEAIVAFDRASQFDGNNVSTYNNKGLALMYLKRYEEAIRAFDEVLRLNPNEVEAYYNKGFALKELKRYEEAIEAYEQFIRLNTNYTESRYKKDLAPRVLNRLPPQIFPKGEALRRAYEQVQNGKVTDPQVIRQMAPTFEAVARDPEANQKITFDVERAAANLYKQAEHYEKIYRSSQLP